MKSPRPFALSLIAAASVLVPASLSAQIINIDFLSQRGSETVAANYVGQGADGGGTVFNGLAAPNVDEGDNINVSGSDLLNSTGGATTVGFSVTDVGSDNSGDLNAGILNGAYIFIDSAQNLQTSASFAISGLTTTSADLFFYSANAVAGLGNPTITLTSGGTETTYTGSISPFNSVNTIEFLDVPVIGGEITGTFGADRALVMGGLTVEEIPEPSTWALMGLGAGFLVWRLRRSGSTI
jgi:hypothetical protein